MITIKINYDKLNELTRILIDNLDTDMNKKINKDEKLALFYIDINNKKYYYSYNILEESLNEVYNSFKIVNYKKAKRLLTEQLHIV